MYMPIREANLLHQHLEVEVMDREEVEVMEIRAAMLAAEVEGISLVAKILTARPLPVVNIVAFTVIIPVWV